MDAMKSSTSFSIPKAEIILETEDTVPPSSNVANETNDKIPL